MVSAWSAFRTAFTHGFRRHGIHVAFGSLAHISVDGGVLDTRLLHAIVLSLLGLSSS
jgi:hypothetical protein